jgi:hypothetical protein
VIAMMQQQQAHRMKNQTIPVQPITSLDAFVHHPDPATQNSSTPQVEANKQNKQEDERILEQLLVMVGMRERLFVHNCH